MAEEEEKKRRGEEIIGDLGILQGRGRGEHIKDGWAEVYIKVCKAMRPSKYMNLDPFFGKLDMRGSDGRV